MVNLRLLEKIVFMPDSKLVLTKMARTYHLNRAGELLGIAMSGKMAAGKFVEGRPDKTDSIEGEATFHATVVGDQMHWTGQVSFRDFGTVEPQLDPSPAPKGVFLNPMHPIRRVRSASGPPVADASRRSACRHCQSRFTGDPTEILSHPQTDCVEAADGDENPGRGSTDRNRYGECNNQEFECLVVELRGDNNEIFRTLVRKTDGQVLRGTATPGGRFVIQRQ